MRRPPPRRRGLSDEILAILSADGDPKAFELLVRRYCSAVYRLVSGHVHCSDEAEKIVIDVFAVLRWELRTAREARPVCTVLSRIIADRLPGAR
ncbi:RNA polymerase sigma factor [Amycolatopsis jejuensis]|uniref:RNA polymerase sigma factor n=1 Tax=Amycolatopsis jejuensis TaxID=330084 RepID=UPI0012E01D36|nr:hypothetical protein [Amycolatopsis jejuensis]